VPPTMTIEFGPCSVWGGVATARLKVWRSYFSLIVRLISVPQLSLT
jgi:hypothetical protein